jgi:hypothetical protein
MTNSSRAAKQAWATRRANAAARSRRQRRAALKAWRTIRANKN